MDEQSKIIYRDPPYEIHQSGQKYQVFRSIRGHKVKVLTTSNEKLAKAYVDWHDEGGEGYE